MRRNVLKNAAVRWSAAIAVLALVFSAGSLVPRVNAQTVQNSALTAPKDPMPLYVVIFCDVTPDYAARGTDAVKKYVADTKKDPGNMRSEMLAQSNRTNHFLILQVWKDTAAFEKHEEAQHTKDFRTTLQPMLGAPFDQRLHFLVE